MSKDASTKYYENNHQRLQEKYRKKYQSPFWRKKKKSNNLGVSYMKISLKMKNKEKLNIEKNITKYGEIKILHKLKVLTLLSKHKKLLFQINIEKFKQVKLLVF